MPRDTDAQDDLREIQELLREVEQHDPIKGLASYVHGAFEEARLHRQKLGVDAELERAQRAYAMVYDPELCDVDEHGIYFPAIRRKADALESWMSDIIQPAEDQPWTLAPTPEPHLSEDYEEVVVKNLEREIQMFGGDPDFDIQERAAELKGLAVKQRQDLARQAAAHMERRITDQLHEGGWRDAFDGYFKDLSVYPNAFIKGPYLAMGTRLTHTNGRITWEKGTALRIERVSPFDIYPSRDSSDCQNGAYLCERAQYSRKVLEDMLDDPLYDELAVRTILQRHPHGFGLACLSTDTERDELADVDQLLNANSSPLSSSANDEPSAVANYAPTYDTIIYYGRVLGSYLYEYGFTDLDPQRSYEAEIWVIDNMVVRAHQNLSMQARRPFRTSSFSKLPGQFWGDSLAKILRPFQRVINGAFQDMVTNISMTSGPMLAVDSDQLDNEEDIEDITPWRVYQKNPNGLGDRPAFEMIKFDDRSGAMISYLEYFQKQIDDMSGVPAYVLGNPQVAGAGRTMGGLSMLMGNAAKGVKKILSNTDKDVIEPLITDYYQFNMLYDPDVTIKGDVQVVARGAIGLLKRELAQARNVEILQVLTSYVSMGIVPPEGIAEILRQVVKDSGADPDKIVPDPQRQRMLEALVAQQAQPGLNLPPQPSLDGRSQPPISPDQLSRLPDAAGNSIPPTPGGAPSPANLPQGA